MKNQVEINFTGTPSGDYECFVFAVDKTTFKQITNREPEEFDINEFEDKTKYNIYPSHLFKGKNKMTVKILITNH